jgi:hypothetical protein
VPSDDEIPDLFPAGPAATTRPSARPSARPSRPSTPPTLSASSKPPALRRSLPPLPSPSRPPPPLPDSERPSRPLPGPSSGLELDVSEEVPREAPKQTAIFGTQDELEFDPSPQPSSRPWEAEEEPSVLANTSKVNTLDLEFAVPGRSESAVPILEIPANSSPSSVPPALKVKTDRPPPSNLPAASGWGSFPAMGNEVELGGGFDDLEFGGAEAAQLNVALPHAAKGDDMPWPVARTPVGDELSVSRQEIEEYAAFGPKPKHVFQTPLYAFRVRSALNDLRQRRMVAERELLEAEGSRDEQLAALGEAKRAELQNTERFALLYSAIDRHDELIGHKRQVLESADVEGAEALRNVQAQIEAGLITRAEREKIRDEKRAIFSEAEVSLRRQQAALQRIQIEWRNIEQRVSRLAGEAIPPELDEKLEVLEQQRQEAEKTLLHSQDQLKQAKKILEEAENEVRLAVAAVQRCEGQKEGILLAYEGDIADYARAVDEAIFHKRQDMAQAGRAIVELRGEVPVEAGVRQMLLEADAAVQRAARQAEIARLAILSMDHQSYRTGRTVGAVIALLFLALLIALAY